jgi:hypothetical protein
MSQAQHNAVCNCMYIHTNMTTFHDSVSRLLVFNITNLFFKILMYSSSADFSGWFQKAKSRKTFDVISTKPVFFKFRFGGLLRELQPGSPPGWPTLYCIVIRTQSRATSRSWEANRRWAPSKFAVPSAYQSACNSRTLNSYSQPAVPLLSQNAYQQRPPAFKQPISVSACFMSCHIPGAPPSASRHLLPYCTIL